jgi:hypothetical protein
VNAYLSVGLVALGTVAVTIVVVWLLRRRT